MQRVVTAVKMMSGGVGGASAWGVEKKRGGKREKKSR